MLPCFSLLCRRRVTALFVNKLLTQIKLSKKFFLPCFSGPVYRVWSLRICALPMSCDFGSQEYKCASPCRAVKMHSVVLAGSGAFWLHPAGCICCGLNCF